MTYTGKCDHHGPYEGDYCDDCGPPDAATDPGYPDPHTIEAQAAEIERLRAALEYLVAECDPDMDDDYNPHAAPLARARAALGKYKL